MKSCSHCRERNGCTLREGAVIEREHKKLYEGIKKYGLPSEEEFYKIIAQAHLRERPDYYTLLKRYVEK